MPPLEASSPSLPFCIIASDGVSIRTIHPPALGEHRAAVEAALAAVLGGRGEVSVSPSASPTGGAYLPVAAAMGAAPVPVHRELPKLDAIMTQGEIARVQGFTGDCCTGCGGFTMRRNGTCLLCTACGATTGCS